MIIDNRAVMLLPQRQLFIYLITVINITMNVVNSANNVNN